MKVNTLLNKLAYELYKQDMDSASIGPLNEDMLKSAPFIAYRNSARDLLKACDSAGIIIFQLTDMTTYTFKRTNREVLYRSIECNRETLATQYSFDPNKDTLEEADEIMISDLFSRLQTITLEE